MLRIQHLDFDYDDKPLLRAVNFHLPKGGLLHLKGKNGSGKTTLLKLIAGLHQPHQGDILFFNQPIQQLEANYQKQISFLGHKTGLNPLLTLKENCFFDLNFNAKQHDPRALAAVFNLEDYLDTPCGLLSAGQKRQVALLRFWMTSASLWLLDEPFTALDDTACSLIMNHIQVHRSKGGAVILSSHQSMPLQESQEYVL